MLWLNLDHEKSFQLAPLVQPIGKTPTIIPISIFTNKNNNKASYND